MPPEAESQDRDPHWSVSKRKNWELLCEPRVEDFQGREGGGGGDKRGIARGAHLAGIVFDQKIQKHHGTVLILSSTPARRKAPSGDQLSSPSLHILDPTFTVEP